LGCAAGTALAEALVTAAALDALAARHMAREEHKLLIQPPPLDTTLKLVVANAGGPAVAERDVLHLSAAERSQASLAAIVENHGWRVLQRAAVSPRDHHRAGGVAP
jgi:hypothetical protein